MTRPPKPPSDQAELYEIEINMAVKLVIATKRTSWPDQPDPPASSLWQRFKAGYQGAVKLPHLTNGLESFHAVNRTLCIDPADGSLLIGSEKTFLRNVVRVTGIPAPQPHGGTAADLPTCTIDMPAWVDITDGRFTTYEDQEGKVFERDVANIAVHNGWIYWVQEADYDVDGVSDPVLGRSANTADLTNLAGEGPWATTDDEKAVGRCLTVIPQAWADAHLGGKRFLMGAGTGTSGNTAGSHGPVAVAVAEPTLPPGQETLATQRLLFWPYQGPRPWVWPDNSLPWHESESQQSIQWVVDGEGVNWVLLFGTRTMGMRGYKQTIPCSPLPIDGPSGYPVRPYVMIYHADDLLPVIAGTKQPDEVYPREIHDLRPEWIWSDDDCFSNRYATAWNQATGDLIVMESNGDIVTNPVESQPVLHVYRLGA